MRRGYRYARCPRGKRWNRRARRCVLLKVPPVKLSRGARKEASEHPWASPAQAQKIARDHLTENPRAYGGARHDGMREMRLRSLSYKVLDVVRENHGIVNLKLAARDVHASPADVRAALRFQPSLTVEVREARHGRSGGAWKIRRAWIVETR